MTTEEKIAMLEDIMDIDEGTLKLSSVLDNIEEWDSLSKLSLIVEAKQQFGLILKAETIRNFKTVQDICDYLK
jgi:acyl carrier protein, putative